MPNADRWLRRCIPSLARLTRARPVQWGMDALDLLPAALFREFRRLPPNHLRIRVGVGNRVCCNQVLHTSMGPGFWLNAVAAGLVRLDGNIADLGCGCGRFAEFLRDYAAPAPPHRFTGTYVGADIDAEAIAWARAHFPADRFRFELVAGASEVYGGYARTDAGLRLPLDDASCDFVCANSLLTHLLEDEARACLAEACRLLRPGGHAQLTAFCPEHLRELGLLGGRLSFAHRVGRAYVESARVPRAAVAYAADDLLALARAAGFADATLFPSGQSVLRCRKA